MIKMIGFIRKKPGVSSDEFFKYWKDTHGPLAAKLVPGLRRYVQNHVLSMPGASCDWDGFVELYFDDFQAYQVFLGWRQSDAARELIEDEDKFVDRRRSRCLVVEHIIV